jgi:hypothetical protein
MSKPLIKATHEGHISIGDVNLKVAVLENGKRIITQLALFQAFGRPMRGSRSLGDQDRPKLPGLIDANNLKPFISSELTEVIKPVKYENLNGKEDEGFDATALPLICEVYIDARNAIKENGNPVLTAKQMPNVIAAEMVLRALSKVGIIGLVDEVTGYQEVRDKTALRDFLEKFLREEKGKWLKTFPDEFFEAIFKMKGWNWKMAVKGQKPGVVGTYINNFVWSRIAPGVLNELKRINPKDEHGRRKGKNPQFIDVDFGHPKLKEHLMVLTMFAKAAGYNWTNWERMVNRALPKFENDGTQIQEINFQED